MRPAQTCISLNIAYFERGLMFVFHKKLILGAHFVYCLSKSLSAIYVAAHEHIQIKSKKLTCMEIKGMDLIVVCQVDC
ncbi:hypothetical protein L1887_09849 [Cichorium endivia]|nr:hypothetical protein L1887_09849 [Cichorium endivia]